MDIYCVPDIIHCKPPFFLMKLCRNTAAKWNKSALAKRRRSYLAWFQIMFGYNLHYVAGSSRGAWGYLCSSSHNPNNHYLIGSEMEPSMRWWQRWSSESSWDYLGPLGPSKKDMGKPFANHPIWSWIAVVPDFVLAIYLQYYTRLKGWLVPEICWLGRLRHHNLVHWLWPPVL